MIHELRAPRRAAVALMAAVWYLAQQWVESVYYDTALRRGAFPPEADSIAIPLGFHFVGWLVFAPIAAFVLWAALRRAPRRIDFLAFDARRPVSCAAWSLGLGALALSQLWFAAVSGVRGYSLDVASCVVGAYVVLALRGAACAPSEASPELIAGPAS